MALGDPAVPEPTGAVAGFDVATVEAWAEPQRAALVELTQELRALEAEADAAERRLVAEHGRAKADPPTAMLTTSLDSMLAKAMVQLDAAVAAARLEAAAVVTAATREATELLASVGADATLVLAGKAVSRPHLVPLLRRPRPAVRLRRNVEVRPLPTLQDTARAPAPPGWLGRSEEPAGALGPEVALWDAGQVNDLFWQTVPTDGAARQLIRVARGGP